MTKVVRNRRPRIAYLLHWFPVMAEQYVLREIQALRRRGFDVTVYSVRRPLRRDALPAGEYGRWDCVYLHPLRARVLLLALVDCARNARQLWHLIPRIFLQGKESLKQRAKAVMQIWLAAYLTRLLRKQRPDHIHANHGYFPAWAAMVASQLEGIPYSVTVHGSDLLVERAFLDAKLGNADTVITISDYNRRVIGRDFPCVQPGRVLVNRLGIELTDKDLGDTHLNGREVPRLPLLLTVGRLHPVKNHEFLIRACQRMREDGHDFMCFIVGGGPLQLHLSRLIDQLGLERHVKLLGPMSPSHVKALYRMADLFVLTSTSEGIPLVVMEAMWHQVPVLVPAITGLPELVSHGETGFLYEAGNLEDLIRKLKAVLVKPDSLGPLAARAAAHIASNYDGRRSAERFAEHFARLYQTAPFEESPAQS